MTRRLTVGTRGSPLALAQAALAQWALAATHPGVATGIVVIRTSGDASANRPLAEIGGRVSVFRLFRPGVQEEWGENHRRDRVP